MTIVGMLATALASIGVVILLALLAAWYIPWNANRLIRKRYYLYCTICKGRLYVNRHPKHNSHTEDCEMRYQK